MALGKYSNKITFSPSRPQCCSCENSLRDRNDKSKCRARKMHVFWSFFFSFVVEFNSETADSEKLCARILRSHSLRFHFFSFISLCLVACISEPIACDFLLAALWRPLAQLTPAFHNHSEQWVEANKKTDALQNAFPNRENLDYYLSALSMDAHSMSISIYFLCA